MVEGFPLKSFSHLIFSCNELRSHFCPWDTFNYFISGQTYPNIITSSHSNGGSSTDTISSLMYYRFKWTFMHREEPQSRCRARVYVPLTGLWNWLQSQQQLVSSIKDMTIYLQKKRQSKTVGRKFLSGNIQNLTLDILNINNIYTVQHRYFCHNMEICSLTRTMTFDLWFFNLKSSYKCWKETKSTRKQPNTSCLYPHLSAG